MPSSNAWVESLGWMLIHSVWLISVIVGVSAVGLGLLRQRSANARYFFGCVTLLLSLSTLPALLAWGLTRSVTPEEFGTLVSTRSLTVNGGDVVDLFGTGKTIGIDAGPELQGKPVQLEVRTLRNHDGRLAVDVDVPRPTKARATSPMELTAWQQAESWLRPHLALLVSGWLAGVCLLSVRPLIGWHSARRLQRVGLSEVSDSLKEMLSRLAGRLGLKRAVRLFQSSLIQIPCVVGAFKPVILLPASAIFGLSPEQLEALLAHELAHIRRHDFAVNVVQTLVETLLFYHPAIWWLSRRVRQEREHCCDDLAISVCGDVAGYARMLVSVEGLRGRMPQTSVAASGGSLVERIRRLLPSPHEQPRSPWLSGIIVLGTLVVLTGSWQWTVGQVSNLPRKEIAVDQADQGVEDRDSKVAGQVKNLPHEVVIGKIEKPDGSPAAKATVIAVRFRPFATRDLRHVVTTNERGEFTLRLSGIAGADASWLLAAFHDNDGGTIDESLVVPKGDSADNADAKPKPTNRVIRLQPGRMVSGTVLDATTQKPIADAKVFSHDGQIASTDARGRFLFRGLAADIAEFIVTSPGLLRTRMDVDVSERTEADVEIALARGGTVRGRVIDPQGRPVANAAVSRATDSAILSAAMTVISDADGRFTFDGFPVNKLVYPFFVSAVGFCCTDAEMVALNGFGDTKEITLRISKMDSDGIRLLNNLAGDNTPPTGAIRGRAIYRGQPVRNFTVRLLSPTQVEPRDTGSFAASFRRFTTADGRFVIGRLDADKRYRVAVTADDEACAIVEPIYARVASTLADKDEFDFHLRTPHRLRVRVLDAESKQPIPNVRVGLKADEPQREEFEWNLRLSGSRTEWTSPGGTALFNNLSAETGPIFVEHPGNARQQTFWTRPPNAEADSIKKSEPDEIVITLRKEARLRLRVGGLDGRDFNNIYAQLKSSTKESFNTDGALHPAPRTLEIRMLPPGIHSLTIYDAASDEPWTPLVTRQVELKPGDNELDVELPSAKPKPNPLNEALKEFGATLNRILPQAEKPTALRTDDVRDKEATPRPPLKTIAGRIVDDQDRPIAEARLWWVVSHAIPDGVIVNAASDEQGRFSISTPDVPLPRPSAGNDTLWILKEGKQLAAVPARSSLVVDGKTSDILIRLEPATDTSFKVVFSDQQPVAGVEVEPWHFRTHMAYDIIPAQARKIMSATTDAEGRVRMPSMPRKGFHTARATSDLFGTQELRLDGNLNPPAERTIELRATGRIEGQLKADNPEWIRGVELLFGTRGDRSRSSWEAEGFASVITDDQGRFTVPVIAAGPLTIYDRPKKEAPVLARLPDSRIIAAGTTEKLEITLESPVLVRGTIRTQDTDKPVPGAEISVRYGVVRQGEHVLSDADGRYEARVLSGPVYTQVIASPKEFNNYQQTGAPWSEKVDVRADAQPFDLPPIKLTPTIPLKGKLIDQDGRPVAKVQINGLNGGRRYGFATTNELGEFSAQIPKTITLEGYQVWLEDGESGPVAPTIEQRDPLILRLTVPQRTENKTPESKSK